MKSPYNTAYTRRIVDTSPRAKAILGVIETLEADTENGAPQEEVIDRVCDEGYLPGEVEKGIDSLEKVGRVYHVPGEGWRVT